MYIAIGIAAALFAADRILKYLSRTGKLKWEGRYVRLTHLENRGFFLGLGQKHEKLLRWLPPGGLRFFNSQAGEAAARPAAGRMAGGGSVSAAGAGQAGLRGTAGHSVGAAGRHQQPMGPAAAGQRDGLSAIPPPKGQKTGAGVEPGGLHAYRRRGADRGRTGEGAYQEIKNRAIGPVFYFSL